YDACDKRGILIWQDFMFACQAYPFFDEEFLANVKQEVEYNVKRISSHPSLALWCGNNEIEDMHMVWINMPKYITWTEKFFWNILEPEIRKYDSQTPYTPGSPIGKSHNVGVYADNIGDTHLWGVWHGLKPMDYYRKRMTRFCSEFGFESLPDMNSIRIFADRSDYSLNSPVFLSHQKCMNGNDKMVYYIATRFDLPKHFRDYVYLSQVTQLECIRDATEHWRRNKGRCNGSMYWQFNDCWGVCSWSSIDYYGNYKALQYGARHFNAPLTVSFEDTKDYIKLFVLNDYIEPQDVELEYSLFDFEKGIIDTVIQDLTVEVRASFDIPSKWMSAKKTSGIVAVLKKDGRVVAQKTCLLDKEKKLDLPKARLSTKIFVKGDSIELHIKTDRFARLVKAECSATHLPFSDNFFDLLPNEEKVITMKLDGSVDARTVAQSIVVYSLTDIEFNTSKINSFAKRAKLYFSPVNIGNAIHHGKVPKDEKL
ncbi:glycoside hydrolase family 2 protein, partial [Eubacterium sp.]|uniref:glycoside hydrolase family 2 protein n=1 Tax=Eubacterium sp. TaxID=142586 RepID=UPI003F0DCE6D